MKCSIFDYIQLLIISWAIQVTKVAQNAKKLPPNGQKMKCSILDYVQPLMIGWVIQAMKVTWNVKKMATKLSKNEMIIFRLCSTSDDKPSDLSDESHPKCKKMATKSSKNKMFIFGLHLTSDDWLSNLSDESHTKCEKMATKWSKMKCSFLDYIQLLMISWAIWATKVTQNVKNGHQIIKKWNVCLWITFNIWWLAKWSKWQKSHKMQNNGHQIINKNWNAIYTSPPWTRWGNTGWYKWISCRWHTTPLTTVP